jgi:ATP:corrinoid adenosyltransferase
MRHSVSDEAVFVAEEASTHFALYDDRIEVVARKRRQVLPLADVVEVTATRRPKKLVVTTGEGKRYEYLLGHEVEAARAAVSGQLRQLAAGAGPR